MSLTLDIQHMNEQAIIKVYGSMDITTMEEFITNMEKLPKLSNLILDFSNLEFIDSTGIGAIIELLYFSKEQTFSITLIGMDESIQLIFEMVGLFAIAEALKKEGAVIEITRTPILSV